MKAVDARLSRWYAADERRLLVIDLCVFGLLVLVHGGTTLAWVVSGEVPDASPLTLWTGAASAVSALACLLAGLLALSRVTWMRQVLRLHSVVLLAYAVWFFAEAIDVAVNGIPAEERFSWNPLLFAFAVTYPPFLWLALHPDLRQRRPAICRIPLAVFVLSLTVSGVVFWRLYQQFAATMADFGL